MSFTSGKNRGSVPKKTTVYGSFRGVDFSVDPSLVEKYRSPYAPNLISDTGGMPEKRLGWRTLHTVEQPVNGLFNVKIGDKEHFLAHGGTKLYEWTDEGTTVLKEGLNNHRSASYFGTVEGKTYLFILTGKEFFCYDGEEIKDVADIAYIPKVFASRNPKGGGEQIDGINLLSRKRKESFYGNATDKIYYLSTKPILSVDKVEVTNANGEDVVLATSEYTVNLTNGTVTFTTAKEPILLGQDNVFITYSADNDEDRSKILNCTIAAGFGGSGNDTIFLSGNSKFKSRIWRSGVGEPHHFPDTGYMVAGSDGNEVMGFQRMGKYLTVIKDDNSQDGTIFQIWGSKDSKGNPVFQMEQGIAGVGAISKNCFSTLLDEPLFLGRQGIFATYTTNVLAERTVKNRSYFVDAVLTKENGLENACAVVWNGYYILSVNSRCYVLDSRNKSYRHNQTEGSGDFVYESYHWDNFPARCFLAVEGALYFGTSDGRVCRLNTDISGNSRFNDDDEAVIAAWSTKNDDDGASYLYKTMQKKGCSVTIKPYNRSSCTVYYSKDGDPEVYVRKHLMDVFDWENLDFERFTFNTNDSPQDVYLKKKVKKYKRLQIIIKNDGKDEGFGILQITKTFTVGNYSKK